MSASTEKIKEPKIKGKKIKFTRKGVIIIGAVLVSAGLLSVLALRAWGAPASPASAQQKSSVRTVTLSKTTLTESVTVTGGVESTSVTNVSSTISYPVAEIFVKEGDSVTEGQKLASLSTEELDKQIARSRESLSDAVTKAQTTYNDAASQKDTAYNNAIAAEATLAAALTAKQTAENAYNLAKSSVSAFQTEYDNAAATEKAAGTELNKANTSLMSNPADQGCIDAQKTAQDIYNCAIALSQAAQQTLNDAKAACGYEQARTAYEAAASNYDAQRKALDNLQSIYSSALKSSQSAAEQLENAKKSDTLTELLEKLEDCVITAPSNGTVTNVNATVGSAPQQNSTLFVIQDTDNLKVSVTIDEYDIKKITTGMKARIKSDATGDEEIMGTVSQVSQTAQSSAASGMGSGSSSAITFGAEISVDAPDSGLLIGMNAKAEIIISEKADVFTVPYDAIGENESGESIVYKREGTEFTPVTVQKGMETDYYVEITSQELSDGDVIRAAADVTQEVEQDTTAIMGMPGGMSFEAGAMTQGGGTPPEGFGGERGGRGN